MIVSAASLDNVKVLRLSRTLTIIPICWPFETYRQIRFLCVLDTFRIICIASLMLSRIVSRGA